MKKIKIESFAANVSLTSDTIVSTTNSPYITQIDGDASYTPITEQDGGYLWTPAQEQKIQFFLNEPYSIMMNGWLVMNPDGISEHLTISINDRPMFHSDLDGNVSFQILVKEGDTITSNATANRYAYFMPCMSELEDWREESLKSDADIWKNAVVTSADGNINVRDQWLENTSSNSWYKTHGSTYKKLVSYIENDEAFDSNGNHLFYIQTENIRTGYDMFNQTALASFKGDLSSLTNGIYMFFSCKNLTSFNSDLSSLSVGELMFARSPLQSFSSDLPSLTTGFRMFYYCTSLESFSGDLSSLTKGYNMFFNTPLTSFSVDLPNLTDGGAMFYNRDCPKLTSFSSDLSSLTSGYYMFYDCKNLTSFSSDLPSLTDGSYMFYKCKLDLASVQNIANTINTVTSGKLTLGIQSSLQGNSDLNTALTAITNKGWTLTTQYNS